METLLACFLTSSASDHKVNEEKAEYNTVTLGQYALISEKTTTSTQEAAAAILSVLQTAKKPGQNFDIAVQDIAIQAGGWCERLAIAVLIALQNALKEGSPLREAMRDVYQKASDVAAGIADFAHEHPLYTAAICAMIALGIPMILTPYIIHALGFGILGPVEGEMSFQSFFILPSYFIYHC